ncbi:MAG: TonB-dependent receptor plug domain-containing protein, partial [Paludibacter sp.]
MKKKRRFPALNRRGIKKLLIVMKLTSFLCFLSVMAFAASSYSQNTRFDLSVKNASVIEVFDEIERVTDFGFLFKTDQLDLTKTYNFSLKNTNVDRIMNELLDVEEYTYQIIDRNIVITKRAEVARQDGDLPKVSGKVTDTNGQSLPGVTVIIKGTSMGTITDSMGEYTLGNVPGSGSLVFSFVGMKSQEIPVGNQSTIDAVMREDAIGIEEVVAIGYGTAKKKDLTGAVSRVNIEETRIQPNANASQTLRGTTAGVQVTDNGRPGSSGSIMIRGRNSISASNDPLIVLDGIIYAGGNLSDINPGDIESIDILKDASSAAIYGSLAANGVIEITTKKGKEGKPRITFNAYTGFSDFAHIPDYMNAEQFVAARK